MAAKRMYVLSFTMENPMIYHYTNKNAKSMVSNEMIKIGETGNWSQRISAYRKNYGCRKKERGCLGCNHSHGFSTDCDHHHVKIEGKWVVDFDIPKRQELENIIKAEFEKVPGLQEYFSKKDLTKIKKRMEELIENEKRNTQKNLGKDV